MVASSTVEILNRLLLLHSQSLPMYLASASPWFAHNDSRAEMTLRHIEEDQRRVIDQIGRLILQLDGVTAMGDFPMTFTDLHDLSLDYLLPHLIDRQKDEIDAIRQCIAQLHSSPAALATAEESLGAAQGHLDDLTELRQASAS